MNNDTDRFILMDRCIRHHHKLSLMSEIAEKATALAGALSPLIFLFYTRVGVNFYVVLMMFLVILLGLRITYVRANTDRRVHLYVYQRMKEDLDKNMQSMGL